jgi:outer membrane autotransporter protein
LPPGTWPIIGPELATYGVVQPIARQLGLTTLGTLHERIGDTLTWANAGGDSPGIARGDWARFYGQQIDNRYQAFADSRASGWLGGFQGGLDLWRGSLLPGHRDAAGIYLAYGHADVGVNGLVTNPSATGYMLTHTGTLNLDAYSAGGYWTHYGPSGGTSTPSRRARGIPGPRLRNSRNCRPTASALCLRWKPAIRCHCV